MGMPKPPVFRTRPTAKDIIATFLADPYQEGFVNEATRERSVT
jgi:hypothetical protein